MNFQYSLALSFAHCYISLSASFCVFCHLCDALPLLPPEKPDQTCSLPLHAPLLHPRSTTTRPIQLAPIPLGHVRFRSEIANLNGNPAADGDVCGSRGFRSGPRGTFLDQVPQGIGARSLLPLRPLFGFRESQDRNFPPLHCPRCPLSPRLLASVSFLLFFFPSLCLFIFFFCFDCLICLVGCLYFCFIWFCLVDGKM
jgi:hypothetical protein